jgi:tripartite-type tricarboxylate transporter receptor subunit TctC
VFVVSNALPAKSIPELIELAKRDPGKLNYGSTGLGSGSHLSTELFMARTGARMTHVPYRGAAPLVTDLMAGRVDVSNSTLPSVLGQIQAGTVRAIGLASPGRNAQVPDVPTLREQGVTGADAESWTAFFAPAATPAPVLDRLSRETVAALNKPSVKEALGKLGFTTVVRDPEAFRPYHAQEIATGAEIIKAAGVPMQG